jgi:excisionase family DNA binding protein
MAALAILALVSTSVLVVINRCMASTANSALRMQAFKIARENMEQLLVLGSVGEKVEYGSSEENPDIQWQTTVETFYEPLTSRMWVRAACSAEYTDTAGEVQTVELTHWLTSLTKKQVLKVLKDRKKEQERLAEFDQLINTVQEAAEYAGVDEETVEEWAESGDMPVTERGDYVKIYLDLYKEHDGDPPPEARMEADEDYAELTGVITIGVFVPAGPIRLPRGGPRPKPPAPGASSGPQPQPSSEPVPPQGPASGPRGPEVIPGYTWPELEALPPEEFWPLIIENFF